ncbi:hypothetical protein KIL84_004256 [Mauremys mutica]|uniref:Uncharacterized protein n=1 Tax=Mauremys mutica TaxID=74926 RepID=A0A9D3XLF2_9SAUR|nr:hypothetical protein KIL84_004256 [Mauremys mutica]
MPGSRGRVSRPVLRRRDHRTGPSWVSPPRQPRGLAGNRSKSQERGKREKHQSYLLGAAGSESPPVLPAPPARRGLKASDSPQLGLFPLSLSIVKRPETLEKSRNSFSTLG